MSLALIYTPSGAQGRKKPDFAQMQRLFGLFCHVGSVGPNFSYSEAPPQPDKNGEMVYMLYGKNMALGRGFCLFVRPDFSQFRMVTPLPTTGHDLDDYFAAVGVLGRYLSMQEFATEERQVFPLEGIDIFRDEMKSDNGIMVKDFADERPGFAVSGVKYPLHMTAVFCEQLAEMDPQASERAFAQCLTAKQSNNYYYLNPNYYRNTDTGETFAMYALSEGVDSIIPKEAFIPYGVGPFGENPVDFWKVALIHTGEKTEVLGTLTYGVFLSLLGANEKEEFDDVHYLLQGLPLARLQSLVLLGEEVT